MVALEVLVMTYVLIHDFCDFPALFSGNLAFSQHKNVSEFML